MTQQGEIRPDFTLFLITTLLNPNDAQGSMTSLSDAEALENKVDDLLTDHFSGNLSDVVEG